MRRVIAPSLAAAIANRRWTYHDDPFPHVVATDVFVPDFYRELEDAFLAALDRRGREPDRDDSFRKDMKGYDALGLTFNPDVAAPFDFFFSQGWRLLLAGLFDASTTAHMSGGLHHHAIGSANGGVHNDLNPGWFVEAPRHDGTIVSDRRICSYATGSTSNTRLAPVEVVRAVAMLFYLANPAWTPGDGGATGLYRGAGDKIDEPVVAIPPINNSALIFECTPVSFHGFIGNSGHARNALILWVHRAKRDAVERWGARSIVDWKHQR